MLSFVDLHTLQSLALTAGFVLTAAVARRVSTRRIGGGRRVLTPAERGRLLWVRGTVTGSLILALVVVWHGELQTLMLSLTAVLVGVVVALKELIQCASGALLRGTDASFRIGDWVEIAGTRGEVVDRTLLTTTLLETDDGAFGYAYTGRTLVIPNIQLFAGAAKLQRFGRDFVFHRVEITFERGPGVTEAMHVWRSEAARLCRPFAERAAAHRRTIEAGLGASLRPLQPKTRLVTTELGKIQLEAELFCPTAEAAALEVRLKTAFIDWLSARTAIASFSRRLDGANANAASAEAGTADIAA